MRSKLDASKTKCIWFNHDECKSRKGGYRGYSPSENLSGGTKYCTSPLRKWWIAPTTSTRDLHPFQPSPNIHHWHTSQCPQPWSRLPLNWKMLLMTLGFSSITHALWLVNCHKSLVFLSLIWKQHVGSFCQSVTSLQQRKCRCGKVFVLVITGQKAVRLFDRLVINGPLHWSVVFEAPSYNALVTKYVWRCFCCWWWVLIVVLGQNVLG